MNGFEIAVLIVFTISMSVQIYFHLILFRKRKQNTANNIHSHFPVSVIIAARNASAELEKNLSSILEQDYPKFEVIVTLDQTTDNSRQILEAYKNQYNNLIILENSIT